MNPKNEGGDEPEWKKKQREFEQVKARAKALKLRTTCTICGEKAKLNCPCGTTQYCSTDCQRIDWRDRGHRKACKKIRAERAAEAARAEAPTPPPSPPREVFYGPAPRSHADEVRARIAAEHEAARARREANPEPEPVSARWRSRCPVCFECWDVNATSTLRVCCCRTICLSCSRKVINEPCPLCRAPALRTAAEELAVLRRHVENEVPEAILHLADSYRDGSFGLVQSHKKAAKIYKRAAELGSVDAMVALGLLYDEGLGVKSDKKRANQLYRAAADRGHSTAQFNLGQMLRRQGSLEEAVVYYARSAQQGYTEAEFNLGVAYGKAQGAEFDLDEATRWIQRAAAKGHEKAIDALRRINGLSGASMDS